MTRRLRRQLTRPVVMVESPYFGHPDSCRYLACCLLDSILRGEAPIASHALYPLALPEHVEGPDGTGRSGREIGLECGESLAVLANVRECFPQGINPGDRPFSEMRAIPVERLWYVDLGWSRGMRDSYTAGVGLYSSETDCVAFKPAEWDARIRTLTGRALEIWLAGEWPTKARLTPNH